MATPGSTERTTLKRIAHKASFSQQELYRILDSNLVAHVGIVFDDAPLVIPMTYGRVGNTLYLHGSSGSRLMRALAQNPKVCISITKLNALKVARSTFNSGMNYDAAVIFGEAKLVEDDKKAWALDAISDAILPGRMEEVRPSTKKEAAATLIIEVELDETSVKISNGMVEDEPEDLGTGVWAGLVPIRTVVGEPTPADDETAALELPQSVKRFISDYPDNRSRNP